MSDERSVLTVRILDKEYRISCLTDEREGLLASARELNERMQEMRRNTKVIGAERMAVMAALNVIHEREQIRSRRGDFLDSAQQVIQRLENKLDAEIGRREQTQSVDS